MKDCNHVYQHQASVELDGLMYDIFYCSRCLKQVKKERVCPYEIEEINHRLSKE